MNPKELRASGLIPDTHVLLPIEVVSTLIAAGFVAYQELCDNGFENAAIAAANVLSRARNQILERMSKTDIHALAEKMKGQKGAILRRLLAAAPQPVPSFDLQEAIWGEWPCDAVADPRKQLRVTIHALRERVRPLGAKIIGSRKNGWRIVIE